MLKVLHSKAAVSTKVSALITNGARAEVGSEGAGAGAGEISISGMDGGIGVTAVAVVVSSSNRLRRSQWLRIARRLDGSNHRATAGSFVGQGTATSPNRAMLGCRRPSQGSMGCGTPIQ
jgi:hypothetical protein